MKVFTVQQNLTSDGSEFHVCGAAAEKDQRVNSVRVFGTIGSGASDDRRGRTGTAIWIRSFIYAGVEEDIVTQQQGWKCGGMIYWHFLFTSLVGSDIPPLVF